MARQHFIPIIKAKSEGKEKQNESNIRKAFIRGLSDRELIDKYNFMTREIESRREMMGLGLSRDIEFKYRLLKEIKKRGLSYE